MGLLKNFRDILVLGFVFAYAGVLAQATYFMAREAMGAHQQGLISLGNLTRVLTRK